MNERIKELAEQTHVTVLTTKGMENISDGCYIVSPDKLQEFAELIVRECLDVMSKKAKEAEERFTYMGDDVPTTVHQSNILKHFGVEL